MIAQLTGLVASLESDRCVIDVHGVGYLVQASTRTLAALPTPPATVRLMVETVVREDAILLYGFADAAERDWFRLLNTVQGVGARVALGILSAVAPGQLAAAIATGDRATLTRVPGVGPKLAIRLLTELRDKAAVMPTSGNLVPPQDTSQKGLAADLLSALANLGYRRMEVQPVVERVLAAATDDATLDSLLRASLRVLAK